MKNYLQKFSSGALWFIAIAPFAVWIMSLVFVILNNPPIRDSPKPLIWSISMAVSGLAVLVVVYYILSEVLIKRVEIQEKICSFFGNEIPMPKRYDAYGMQSWKLEHGTLIESCFKRADLEVKITLQDLWVQTQLAYDEFDEESTYSELAKTAQKYVEAVKHLEKLQDFTS